MKKYEIEYTGELRTNSLHIKSGQHLITDAPTDNNGKGEAFSPTDLIAVSLVTCILTVMGIKANQLNLNELEMTSEVDKAMASDPRRVEEISAVIRIKDKDYSDKTKSILENTGINCPVAKSLHPDISQNITFEYY